MLAQFAGNRSFRADCFQLDGIKVVTSTIDAISVGTTNIMFFPSVDTDNGDALGLAYRFFVYCGGVSTVAHPWSEITSGNNQKYNLTSYLNDTPLPLPPSLPVKKAIEVQRGVSQSVIYNGGTVLHSVLFINKANQPVYITSIKERQAVGTVYAGIGSTSQVNPGTSTISPTLGAGGTLEWLGQPQISYRIPASGTISTGQPGYLSLVYTSTLPSTPGIYTNWISATIGGDSTQAISVTVEVADQTPTAVNLASFQAIRNGSALGLTWETSSETHVLGFLVYRQRLAGGEWELLTPELIPAQAPGMLLGSSYTWLDTTAEPETGYLYRLVEMGQVGPGIEQLDLLETAAYNFVRFLPAIRN